MFIVHCSHGATLIFDDVFFILLAPSYFNKNVVLSRVRKG